jgi:hypothetical protein
VREQLPISIEAAEDTRSEIVVWRDTFGFDRIKAVILKRSPASLGGLEEAVAGYDRQSESARR